MASDEDLKAEIERLRAENEALKKPTRGQMSLKVSEKGGLSVYGLGRFPVTLYKEQWGKLLGMADEIRKFIRENDSALKTKGSSLRRPTMPIPSIEVVDMLFRQMDELVPSALYPAHVLQIPERRIKGTGFFPGGSGLYYEERDRNAVEFPFGGVMILGHNFDSEAGFKKSVENGSENLKNGTWRSLLNLLKAASIPIEKCFFTNAFMGLCEGGDNKKYLGRGDPEFRAACLEFLKAQIKTQRPRLILALGLHVPPLLASASHDLTDWTGQRRSRNFDPELHLRDIDRAPIFLAARFDFDDGSFHTSVVTAIAHPSDRRNSEKRAPHGFLPGRAGEAQLIQSGWESTAHPIERPHGGCGSN